MTKPPMHSGEWFRTRTDAELQNFVDGNMPGPYWNAAKAEMDRRAAASDHAGEMRWIKRAFWASIAGLVIGLASIAATFLASE